MIGMSFQKLMIWQRSMTLAKRIYDLTKNIPKQEQFGLMSQMKRAALSIPSNIAEGSQRTSDKDFANFILIARGSLAELQTQLLFSRAMNFINEQQTKPVLEEIEEISKMLYSFHSKLKAKSSKLL
jgi:four helix bundle protein